MSLIKRLLLYGQIMRNRNCKILVTGAAGFIGYHMVMLLIKNRYIVIGLDNLNDYYDVTLKHNRLKECGIYCSNSIGVKEYSCKYRNYGFYKADISDYESLINIFETEHFDYVINLAGQAGVRYSIERPVEYVMSNMLGFLNILECCKSFGVQNVLYASSSSVYGSCTQYPFREDAHINNMLNIYAVSKKSNEEMANVYRNLYGINIVGFRFFSVYGPWGRPDMAMMLFTKAILCNEPINVFNNGKHKRDFTYVDDIVNSIYRLILSRPEEWAPIYNIGNSDPVSLTTLIEILESKIGKKGIYNYCPLQQGDIENTYADMSLFRNQFGEQKFTSINDGINNFLRWYLEYYSVYEDK